MSYKKEFIKFMCEAGVLIFGDFVTKSGRNTPYFINTGNYKTGEHIARLGEFYAECIIENKIESDILFGPAYKGIPLCAATAAAMFTKYNKNCSYCFNRKEAKDHGEGGLLIGCKPKDGDKVTIIEDVITAGTAVRETLPLLKNADVNSIVISVDRMEKGRNEKSAAQEVYEDFGIRVYSLVTIEDIIDCIRDGTIGGSEYLEKMLAYRELYGV